MRSPDGKPMSRSAASTDAAARVLLAAIAWFGVLLQLWLSIRLAHANGKTAIDGIVVFLGYFTVLTNLFVALVAMLPLLTANSRIGRGFGGPLMRGCATTAILTVGIGYHLLLRNIWNPQGLQWVADMVLHYLVPAATAAYWIGWPPRARLPAWAPLAWTLYPAGYAVYALVRGEVLGAYPYPFIDVGQLGYGPVAVNLLALLAVFVALGFAVRAVAHARIRARR